jgi:hypothetical protein
MNLYLAPRGQGHRRRVYQYFLVFVMKVETYYMAARKAARRAGPQCLRRGAWGMILQPVAANGGLFCASLARAIPLDMSGNRRGELRAVAAQADR